MCKTEKKEKFPPWLPKSVSKWADEYKASLSDPSKEAVWKRLEGVLYTRDNNVKKIWQWLEEISSDAPRAFMEEIWRHLSTSETLRDGGKKIRSVKKLIKQAISPLKKAQIALRKIDELDGLSQYSPLIDELIHAIEAREDGIKYMEENICPSTNVFGLGRKENSPTGQSVSFALRLAGYMEELGVPSLDMPAEITNAIFGTSYTGTDISGMRKRRKKRG